MNYEQIMYAAFHDELIKQADLGPAFYSATALAAPVLRRIGGLFNKAKDLQYHPNAAGLVNVMKEGGGHMTPTLLAASGHYGGKALHTAGDALKYHPLKRAGEVVHGMGNALAHTMHIAHP